MGEGERVGREAEGGQGMRRRKDRWREQEIDREWERRRERRKVWKGSCHDIKQWRKWKTVSVLRVFLQLYLIFPFWHESVKLEEGFEFCLFFRRGLWMGGSHLYSFTVAI